MQNDSPISVSELNRLARQSLEKSLPIFWVSGEVSNLTRATSGHWYFTLKDSSASVRCVMFRSRNQFVDWQLHDGEHIEIRAQASLYEPRGDFQLTVEAMRHAGRGSLYEAFLRLKTKLDMEGLFSAEIKRSIPTFPQIIGLITSIQGAALHDALSTLNRRWPLASVILYPCSVQGSQAPEQIISAFIAAETHAQCDVLLLLRGGGSLEDLLAYNDEAVARAIAACRIPIISGVGHETDFSIADFVADLRAPTPTAAAEAASPDQIEMRARLMNLIQRLASQFHRSLNQYAQNLDLLTHVLQRPNDYIRLLHSQQQQLLLRLQNVHSAIRGDLLESWRGIDYRLARARPELTSRHMTLQQRHTQLTAVLHGLLSAKQYIVRRVCSQIDLLNPRAVLSRGYALVSDSSGKFVTNAQHLNQRDILQIEFATGKISAEVILD